MFGSCLRPHELQLGVRPAVRYGSNDSCDGKRSVIALQRSEWIVVGSPFDSGVAAGAVSSVTVRGTTACNGD
jgi:hypothetical protein